jgi:hypothetical protein
VAAVAGVGPIRGGRVVSALRCARTRALPGAGERRFPFGEGAPQSALSILGGVRAETGAPVIAALGVVGATVAVAMVRTQGRGVSRAVLLVVAGWRG